MSTPTVTPDFWRGLALAAVLGALIWVGLIWALVRVL